MIYLTPNTTGLSFHDWLEVLRRVNDGEIIGSFEQDNLSDTDKAYLHIVAAFKRPIFTEISHEPQLNQKATPKILLDARGIGGAWHSNELKKYLIIDKTIQYRKLKEKRPELWTHLPHLARLRPFYTCSRRKFLVGLGLRPNQIYATTYCKPWTDNELLNSELETLSLWSNFYRVICIDLPEEYFKKLQKAEHQNP